MLIETLPTALAIPERSIKRKNSGKTFPVSAAAAFFLIQCFKGRINGNCMTPSFFAYLWFFPFIIHGRRKIVTTPLSILDA
jgi:hypothetical protein